MITTQPAGVNTLSRFFTEIQARISQIRKKYLALRDVLDERARRLWAAAEARAAGRGGFTAVLRATGMSSKTLSRGLRELDSGEKLAPGRVRRPGAGRKSAKALDPGLAVALEELVEPVTRGDPESPLRWISKSLRQLSEELRAQGYQASHTLVGQLLREAGYSLQANRKTREGANTLISAYNISQHGYDGGLGGIFAQNGDGDGNDDYRAVDDVYMYAWISSQWELVWSSAFYLYNTVTLTYDDAGNTENDGQYKYTYDAWNRLKDTSTWSNDSMVERDYDARGRLILAQTYADGGVDRTDQYYYNINRQQIIEVRDGSDNVERHVVYG